MRSFLKFVKDEKGSVIVLFAIAMTVVIGMAALVVDVGSAYAAKQKLYNTVDAASLAAAKELPNKTNATVVAGDYFELNGLDRNQITQIDFEKTTSDPKKIRIHAIGTTKYKFASIFNNGKDETTVHAVAAAEKVSILGNFDYAIFSGSTLDLLAFTGSKTTVVGDVHCNQDIKGTAEVDGEATVAGEFKDNKLTATDGKSQTTVLNMPDFSEDLKDIAQDNGTYYSSDMEFTADEINAAFAKGSVIYVDGNIKTNGSGVNTSAGTIVATGNITFGGSGASIATAADSSVCLYSINGDVTFNGGGSAIYGIIYAPKGEVRFDGSTDKIYGRLYGDTVNLNGNMTIDSSADDFESIPVKRLALVE